jgi:heat shock protein HslJ
MTARALLLAVGLAVAACTTPALDGVSVACARGRPGPIEGEWALERIDGVRWSASRATLVAEPTGFAGSIACNGYGTHEPDGGGDHYAIEEGRLVVKGGLITTTAGCLPRERMAFEHAFLGILDSQPHVAVREEGLCLFTDDGRSLEFRRTSEEERS